MRKLAFIFLLLMGAPTVARADDRDRSLEKYNEGIAAYKIQDYDAAIVHFRESYLLDPSPNLLFNIARAYQMKGDPVQALTFYKQFVKDAPDDPTAPKVRIRIEELEKEVAERKRQQQPPPPQPLPDPKPRAAAPMPAPTPVDAAPRHSGRAHKIAGLATAGAGVALVATGVVFALQASAAQQQLDDARAAHEPWSDALAATDSEGRTDSQIATITLAAGAVAAVAGGVMFALGVHQDRVRVVPTAERHTAGLRFEVRF
jgi:iron complex outermembrane receptor protein